MSTGPAAGCQYGVIPDAAPDPAPVADMAVQRDETPGPARPSLTEVPIAAPDPAPLVDVQSKGIDPEVSTMPQHAVMRSPMVPDASMLSWAYEHAPFVQLAMCAVFVALLVAMM